MKAGKSFRLTIEAGSADDALSQAALLAERLLSNPVIEDARARLERDAVHVTRVGVIVFPGSNCEYDAVAAIETLSASADLVWHSTTDLSAYDAIILPGGFAHGDYLRPGALARFSPVMEAVTRFAAGDGPILGICNGFQVLTEAGLLPGRAAEKCSGLTFLCQPTTLIVSSTRSVLTANATLGQELVVPINHFSGSYTCDDETLRPTRRPRPGRPALQENPNGSRGDVAGSRTSAATWSA